MTFAYEKEMYGVIAAHLDGLFSTSLGENSGRTLKGRPVGSVVPDFLWIRSPAPLGTDRPREVTVLEAAVIAALLPGRPLRIHTIAEQLFTSAKRLDPRLRALVRAGVIEALSGTTYVLRAQATIGRIGVIAVEAKLRRWREALRQAATYRLFANQAYVALPDGVALGNAELVSASISARVGIIAVSPERSIVVREAPWSRIQSADWVWLVARTIGLPWEPVATCTC